MRTVIKHLCAIALMPVLLFGALFLFGAAALIGTYVSTVRMMEGKR